MRIIRTTRIALPAVLILAAGLVALTSSATAYARGGKHGPAAFALEHSSELGLTTDQVQRIEALRAGQRTAMAGKRDAMRSQWKAFGDLLATDPIDRTAAEKTIDVIVKDMADHQRSRLQARVELAEILTPDQRNKLREMERSAHRARRGR